MVTGLLQEYMSTRETRLVAVREIRSKDYQEYVLGVIVKEFLNQMIQYFVSKIIWHTVYGKLAIIITIMEFHPHNNIVEWHFHHSFARKCLNRGIK